MKTTITPFSNGNEYLQWMETNCYRCKYYETKSRRKEDAGCPAAFDIDLASAMDGTIPELSALMIGWTEKDGMPLRCSKNIIRPVKIDLSNINQLKLF